jgi:hypothetical protein
MPKAVNRLERAVYGLERAVPETTPAAAVAAQREGGDDPLGTPRTAALVQTVFDEDKEAEELPDCETEAIPRRT